MTVFNIYRRGYELGYSHGSQSRRRIANWEMVLVAPIVLVPLVDRQSFVDGYQRGFDDGAASAKFLARARGRV